MDKEVLYVVLNRDGKVRKQRRKARVFTTVKGAAAFATADGDSVVPLVPDTDHEPIIIAGRKL